MDSNIRKSLIALAFGTLGLGVAEFVMMGILPNVASSLGITIPVAGHLISAYALGVCFGAIMLLMLRKYPMKNSLLFLVTIMVIGNGIAVISPSYTVMLLARFISGLPHGAYFGVASIVASKIAQEGKESEAVAIMISGMTVANLFGVPLGTFISGILSWRLIFLFIVLWDILTIFLIKKYVPYVDPLPDTGFLGQFKFLKNLAPWLILGATMMGNGGAFCWYSYVTPMFTEVSGFAPEIITALMVLAGLGMVIGNMIGGKLSSFFYPGKVGALFQGFMAITLLGIFFLSPYKWAAVLLMCIVTLCLFAVSAPQQFLIIKFAPGGEMLGAAGIQIAFNLGNAIGAYLGGLPITYGVGVRYSALIASGITILGFILFSLFTYLYQPNKKTLLK